MAFSYPILGDLWPYSEAAVPPEIASLPVDVFFTNPKGSSITAAQWTRNVDPMAAPRSSYALRLSRGNNRSELARWNPVKGLWQTVAGFDVPDSATDCSIIELRGIVLNNVDTVDALAVRLANLLQSEQSAIKILRLTSKVLSVLSIIILFFAVRAGVEANAIEPFALIFSIACGVGLAAISLRSRGKIIGEQGLDRMRDQFQFEYRSSEHTTLSVNNVATILQDTDRKREEEAVIFGFLLLLCFVYFISPLVVIGVIVALIVVTLMTGDLKALRILSIAYERTETRLAQAFLSFRAGNDALSPPALRDAKKQVLRDRIRRYGDILAKVRTTQARFRLSQDLALGMAFVIIFSAYAIPIAAGIQKVTSNMGSSLVSTSLFSVAPVIILLSISRSTVALAQIVNRQIVALAR
ncbi:MAG: hypothetical protein ACU0CA_06020 [Paracoccaceae bacterium]